MDDNIIFVPIILCSIVGSVFIGSYFLVLKPWEDHVAKDLNDTAKQLKDERNKIELMSCKDLKNGLLHDTIYFDVNIQRASERYIGMCE